MFLKTIPIKFNQNVLNSALGYNDQIFRYDIKMVNWSKMCLTKMEKCYLETIYKCLKITLFTMHSDTLYPNIKGILTLNKTSPHYPAKPAIPFWFISDKRTKDFQTILNMGKVNINVRSKWENFKIHKYCVQIKNRVQIYSFQDNILFSVFLWDY